MLEAIPNSEEKIDSRIYRFRRTLLRLDLDNKPDKSVIYAGIGYSQIVDSMAKGIRLRMGDTVDITSGSVLHTLLNVIAEEIYKK